jgi:hypothetical protein
MRDQLTDILGDDLLDYQLGLLAMAERVEFNVKTMPQKRPELRHVKRRLRGLEIGQIIIDDAVMGGRCDNTG